MPKFRVTDSLNHAGQMLGPGAEVDLPLNVAGDPAVRGHIEATDDEGKLAFTSLPTTTDNRLMAGAPHAEHEVLEQQTQLQSERQMFQSRIETIDKMLAANNQRLKELREGPKGPQGPADAGAPQGPQVAPIAGAPQATPQQPGTFAAPPVDGGAPAGPATNDGPDQRHTAADGQDRRA
jgi:hypothetical protein